jgi:hypothetical protein
MAGDNEREPANQEALFVHFDLILSEMCHVRKATTCAQRVLEANTRNCNAVTEAHLDALVDIMQKSSARYSW